MNKKIIDHIFEPPAPNMVGDGFRVHNFIPGIPELNMQRMSPFILMDYNSLMEFQAKEEPRGVGVHPHRGFETVTLAYEGKIAHHDSAGNSGIIGKGEVQWMTAASGILHKEYHESNYSKSGGPFQMVQLWINLPAEYKMTMPRYQSIDRSNICKIELSDSKGYIDLIAGDYNGNVGPAKTFTPIHMMNAYLHTGAKVDFNFPSNYTTLVLMVKGSAKINDDKVGTNQICIFKYEGENFQIETEEESIVLILSGEPIHEPIVAYGPFVMNSKEEILKAYDDLNKGLFGKLKN
jgi:redox-sensitive bicupin YhaK (pirin superfamily)